jgi:23S rRNA (pseudouridine1915-N3)-methyltransferase
MQRVIIRAIGKLGAGWSREAAADFLERIRPFAMVDIVELPEGHDGSAKPDLVRTRQAEAISLLKGIPESAFIIALDETGKNISSTVFSDRVRTWSEGGRPIVLLFMFFLGLHIGVCNNGKGDSRNRRGLGSGTMQEDPLRMGKKE